MWIPKFNTCNMHVNLLPLTFCWRGWVYQTNLSKKLFQMTPNWDLTKGTFPTQSFYVAIRFQIWFETKQFLISLSRQQSRNNIQTILDWSLYFRLAYYGHQKVHKIPPQQISVFKTFIIVNNLEYVRTKTMHSIKNTTFSHTYKITSFS